MTPAGELATLDAPASAAGPSLRELVVGSEGVLGVISSATLRVRPAPAAQRYEAWSLPSFEAGAEAFQALEQGGAAPDVARLSDEHETRLTMALGSSGGLAAKLGRLYLRGFGPRERLHRLHRLRRQRRRRSLGAAAAPRRSCAPTAPSRSAPGPGRSWLRGRFAAPYLRDELMDRGVMVETLETATTWSNLTALYDAVGDALRKRARRARHAAARSCATSPTSTRRAPRSTSPSSPASSPGEELDQWRAAKTPPATRSSPPAARSPTTTRSEPTTAPWMTAEIGDLGIESSAPSRTASTPPGS